METVYLERDQVPAHLRAGYTGMKFKARVCESVTIPSDAGLWDSGSRDVFHAIRLADGASVPLPGQKIAPWDARRQDRECRLESGIAIIERSTFRSKDMGVTFYVHPADATALLPAPSAPLTGVERMVLEAAAFLKSSYGGRDRYQMKTDDLRWDSKPYPTRDEWDAAKQSLITKGLLNKAGAVTVAGRNAARSGRDSL